MAVICVGCEKEETMRILEIGPSETRARGGMSEVIRGIRESGALRQEFEIDSFPSFMTSWRDGKRKR